MAEVELAPLSGRLGDEEIAVLASALEEVGAPQLQAQDEAATRVVAEGIDADFLIEFLDRLDARDISCDLYLPVDFDGRVDVGDLRVGSSTALLQVLDEMREEQEISGDDDEEEESDGDVLVEERVPLGDPHRALWRIFHVAAQASLRHRLPIHVVT